MPVTKSAKKALRSSQHKRKFNQDQMSKVKTAKRSLLKFFNEEVQDTKEIGNKLSEYFKAVDKAAKIKVIHKNKANRLKSRICLFVNKMIKTS
jgi:small subunit ribosomal protein S20